MRNNVDRVKIYVYIGIINMILYEQKKLYNAGDFFPL